jgi:aerobic-type carbon monoxide dehydrogenase small subunit (CoxS/CutS family)
MRGLKNREQASTSTTSSTSSSTTTSYVTLTPTATNTATVPPPAPVVATDPMGVRTITLNVNGANYNVNVEPRSMLVDVIREDLGLIATKRPCNRMSCGACTVLIDGVPHESCTYIALRAVGHSITTSEVATGDAVVNALQQAWVVADGGQCSYCASGFIMAATALLKANSNPTIPQIKAGLSGNICRCGNYMHIITAVQQAAASLGGT